MEQQICLRWNNFHVSFASTFEALWDEESFCDVTLFCEGQQVSAHKVVLSACSSVFKALLKKSNCQNPMIILHKLSFSTLEAILQFIYRGEVNIEHDELDDLLEAAALLQIRGLANIAQRENTVPTESNSNIPRESCMKKRPDGSKGDGLQRKRAKIPSPTPTDEENPLFIVAKEEPLSEEESFHLVSNEGNQEKEVHNGGARRNLSAEAVNQNLYGKGCNSTGSLQSPPEAAIPDSIPGLTQNQVFTCRNSQPPPYPCPFCCRAYSSWGFRRRHIKTMHMINHALQISPLPCKWCGAVLPSRDEWENHVVNEHNVSQSEAEQGLKVLEEAHMVLQNPNDILSND